jgi:hypothetical protein
MYQFPTREELEAMSVEQIKALYPMEPKEEALMQEVIDKKMVNVPILDKLDRSDVPDIRTPQDEAKWQKVLDERQAKIDKQFKGEAYLEDKLKKLEAQKAELEPKVFCEECRSKHPRFHKKTCSKFVVRKSNAKTTESSDIIREAE